MRICVDIDGTLCPTRQPNQWYEDIIPFADAVDALRQIKKDGHEIVLYTARNMKTCNNSLGQIIAKQVPIIIDWLNKHNIPYDEIWPGKPLAELYIDDRSINPNVGWHKILETIQQEKQNA